MRSYLDGMTKDKPPVYWPRTREAVYLGDIDESRRIVVDASNMGCIQATSMNLIAQASRLGELLIALVPVPWVSEVEISR
jgi:hypothetical protein